MIGQTISHYKIIEKLGEGGMGIVYKAEDLKLDRYVALKFLPTHFTKDEVEKKRFVQEAKAASALDHPNICTIHEIDETGDGRMFIAMGYYEGQTLVNQTEQGKLTLDEAIDIAMQAARGLAKAHEKGIVHRDIKPANIMVTQDGTVKLLDFGLAKVQGRTKLTKTGSTIGTMSYMSPEQARGEEIDSRSDIFSLGVVLYEMIAGQRPFKGEHDAAIIYSIVNMQPEPLTRYKSGISQELQRIINKALEKEPDMRYQHIDDLLTDLRRERKISSGDVIQETIHFHESKRFYKKLPVVGGTLLVLLASIVVLLLQPWRSDVEINPNMTFRTINVPLSRIGVSAISSDGNWVVFPMADAAGKWEIYMTNVAGGGSRRITADSGYYIQQVDLSPDGSSIVYDRINLNTRRYDVFKVSTLGGVGSLLAQDCEYPRWKKNGQRIAFLKVNKTEKYYELWSMNTDGTDQQVELSDSTFGLEFFDYSYSPDGVSFVWVKKYPGKSEGELVISEAGSGNQRQLTNDKKRITDVYWASNNQIVYATRQDDTEGSIFWVIPAAGGIPKQLTRSNQNDYGPRVSVDGKRLIYVQNEHVRYLWIATIDGNKKRQLTFDGYLIRTPTLSPDRRWIAFSMPNFPPQPSNPALYVMDRDGNNRRQLTDGKDQVSFPRWSPDGKWIAYNISEFGETEGGKLYITEAFGSSKPLFAGNGVPIFWINSTKIVTDFGILDLSTRKVTPVFEDTTASVQDSIVAVPVIGGKYILYQDYREDRQGIWIIESHNSADNRELPKKLLSWEIPIRNITVVGNAFIYVDPKGETWRVSLPSGEGQNIGSSLPEGISDYFHHVSDDGKEVVYLERKNIDKLIVIENPFN